MTSGAADHIGHGFGEATAIVIPRQGHTRSDSSEAFHQQAKHGQGPCAFDEITTEDDGIRATRKLLERVRDAMQAKLDEQAKAAAGKDGK